MSIKDFHIKNLIPKNKKTIYILIGILIFIMLVLYCILLGTFNNSVNIRYTISASDLSNVVSLDNAEYIEMNNENNIININNEGTYVLSGTCDSGHITIESNDSIIYLVLNNLNLTNTLNCINIIDVEKVYIYTLENTDNYLTTTNIDSSVVEDACIYSKDDLTINGLGTLTINSNYNGIRCNDNLIITNLTLNINSTEYGIKANDSFQIENANITIVSNNDGIHVGSLVSNYTTIKSGTINITSVCDGIDSYGTLGILGGNITIDSGQSSTTLDSKKCLKSTYAVCLNGGTLNLTSTEIAIKSINDVFVNDGDITITSPTGIKTDNNIYINGSTLSIKSSSDSLHSKNDITINDGDISISAGDDGIHTVDTLKITGGTIDIKKSYEGIEAIKVIITGGYTSVVSSDDGININCSPNDSMGGLNRNTTYTSSSGYLKVTGGTLYVHSKGDGLDSNDKIVITGGLVLVDGPTSSANGALDYDTTCKVTGGTLIAVGSTGMAQNTTGGQCSFLLTVSVKSNQTLLLTDEDGNFIMAYDSAIAYQSIVYSSSKLKKGKTYIIYVGASIEGESVNGYYDSGTIVSYGTKSKTFTMSSKQYGGTSSGVGGTDPGGRR